MGVLLEADPRVQADGDEMAERLQQIVEARGSWFRPTRVWRRLRRPRGSIECGVTCSEGRIW